MNTIRYHRKIYSERNGRRSLVQRATLSISISLCVLIAAWGTLNTCLADTPHHLVPGYYRYSGPGNFRRVIVAGDRVVSYDIWRITPAGRMGHLRFDLLPPTNRVVESGNYRVVSEGRDCGTADIRFYHATDKKLYPEILILRFNDGEVALSSGGRPPSAQDTTDDETEIAQVTTFAQNPQSYSRLTASMLLQLNQAIPICR